MLFLKYLASVFDASYKVFVTVLFATLAPPLKNNSENVSVVLVFCQKERVI